MPSGLESQLTAFMERTEAFEWIGGQDHARLMLLLSVSYVPVVLGLRALLRGKQLPLGPLPAVHNLVLCFWSLAMFSGTLYHVLTIGASTGYRFVVCLPPGTKMRGGLYFWAYSYYISKYYEWIDTLILILKGKPLTLLHVWHHAAVVPMSYYWLEHAQSLHTVGLLFNTGIHVIMYAYYFLTSIRLHVPAFKFAVTNGQIIQFVSSFLFSIPLVLMHFGLWPWDDEGVRQQGCSGMKAWALNCVFNFTLLVLFVNFHRKTYRKKAQAAGKKAN
eukprot:jgi/Mesvir1/21889/Mv01958-RA.1